MEKTARGWREDVDIVGEHVVMYLDGGDELTGTVVAEHARTGSLKVRDAEGALWIGNQWDFA